MKKGINERLIIMELEQLSEELEEGMKDLNNYYNRKGYKSNNVIKALVQDIVMYCNEKEKRIKKLQ